MKEIFSYLFIAGASQGFLLGFALLTRPANHRANRYLAFLILWISFTLLGRFFWHQELFNMIIFFDALLIPSMGLPGPLIYFYTGVMTGKKFTSRQILPHFLPAGIFFIATIIIGIFLYRPVSGWKDLETVFSHPLSIIGPVYMHIIILAAMIYAMKAWLQLRAYSAKIRDFVSDVEKISLRWLQKLLVMILTSFTVFNIMHIQFLLTGPPREHEPPLPGMIFILIQVSIIIYVAYYALRQPDIFQFLPSEGEVNGNRPDTPPRYEKQGITENQMEEYQNRLDAYMKTNRPYLDEDLTLKDLASRINIPGHHLSMTLNMKMNQNFYLYINSFRIKEVKHILSDSDIAGISILDAAYRSGFRSKSTFNKVFKEVTGETPTEYRLRLTSSPGKQGIS